MHLSLRGCAAIGSAAVVWASLALAATSPSLETKLIGPEVSAKKASATIEAQVSGIQLVDPAKVQEKPHAGQGHLHYRVDQGPVIATTTTKLSFHELSPGKHHISVSLVGNDHKPLGPHQDREITIPSEPHAHGM